jgi:hypothetical protein
MEALRALLAELAASGDETTYSDLMLRSGCQWSDFERAGADGLCPLAESYDPYSLSIHAYVEHAAGSVRGAKRTFTVHAITPVVREWARAIDRFGNVPGKAVA